MNLISLIIFLAFFNQTCFSQTGTIKVVVTNVKNNEGTINVALYNEKQKDVFLKKPDSAFQRKIVAIMKDKAAIIFKDVPYGKYAISVFHDKNNNGKIDRTSIGFPDEATGISGNIFFIGPPKFKTGKFDFKKKEIILGIKLKNFP